MYKIPSMDPIAFSPSCQKVDFFNFYESLKIVYRVTELFDDIFEDLETDFNQISMQNVLALKVALLDSITESFDNQKRYKIRDIEDTVIFDDENLLLMVLLESVKLNSQNLIFYDSKLLKTP